MRYSNNKLGRRDEGKEWGQEDFILYMHILLCQRPEEINDTQCGMLQIKRYYHFKQKHSNLYDGLVPSKNKNIFDHNILTVLPNRDQFGRRVLILELGSESLSHSTFSEE
jgi:hypothetical protein